MSVSPVILAPSGEFRNSERDRNVKLEKLEKPLNVQPEALKTTSNRQQLLKEYQDKGKLTKHTIKSWSVVNQLVDRVRFSRSHEVN